MFSVVVARQVGKGQSKALPYMASIELVSNRRALAVLLLNWLSPWKPNLVVVAFDDGQVKEYGSPNAAALGLLS